MALFSRPTSVVGSRSVRRWLKSPAAIAMAVDSTRPSRRNVSVTKPRVSRAAMMMVTSATVVNTPKNVAMMRSTSFSERATTWV